MCMLMDSYLKKVAVDVLLDSYYFDMKKKKKIMHGLLLYYFLTTVNNVPGSYPVTNIAKTFIEMPSSNTNHMSQKYPFKKLVKTLIPIYSGLLQPIVLRIYLNLRASQGTILLSQQYFLIQFFGNEFLQHSTYVFDLH